MAVVSEQVLSVVTFVMNISGLVSLLLNIVLLPIILICSGKDIGSYRIFLFLYTSVSAVFSVVNYFATPMFAVDEYGWVLYAASLRVRQDVGSWTIVVYCGCYMSLLLTLTFSYIYRYTVMCRPKMRAWFRAPSKLAAIAIICLTCFCIWTGVTAVFLRPTIRTNEEFRSLIKFASGRDSEGLSYIAMHSYVDNKPLLSFLAIVFMRILFISASASIIGWCTAKIIGEYRVKAAATSIRSRTHRIQTQLFILLIIQTLMPLLFSLAPALLSYMMALFRVNCPLLSFYSSTLLPVSQIIDPILTIVLVADYRRAPLRVYRYFQNRYRSIYAVSSVSNSQ